METWWNLMSLIFGVFSAQQTAHAHPFSSTYRWISTAPARKSLVRMAGHMNPHLDRKVNQGILVLTHGHTPILWRRDPNNWPLVTVDPPWRGSKPIARSTLHWRPGSLGRHRVVCPIAAHSNSQCSELSILELFGVLKVVLYCAWCWCCVLE